MTLENMGPFLADPSGDEHRVPGEGATIGRDTSCEVVVASKSVSREHCRVYREGLRWFVEDMGSTNGTFLNGERIVSARELRDEDSLQVGEVTFVFHDPETTTRHGPLPDLEIDASAGVVRVNRKPVVLSPKEYQLLSYLHQRRGQVCSKDDIGHAVWPEYEAGGIFDYQIENLVRRLRTRIENDPADPQLLCTVRGLGYKLIG
jgi:pSer/pThr/pTyr-binding forkhead associated (FHA) protein